MGKMALLIVFASSAALAVSNVSRQDSNHKATVVLIDYEEKVLAREVATSWLNVEIARLKNDFEGHRLSHFDAPYNGGYYDINITEAAGDTVHLVVNGYNGHAGYEISATLVTGSSTEEIPEFFSAGLNLGGNLNIWANTTFRADGLNNASIRTNGNINVDAGNSLIEGFGWYAGNVVIENGQSAEEIFAPVDNPAGNPVTERMPSVDIPVVNPSELQGSATKTTNGKLELEGEVTLGTINNPTIWYVDGQLSTTVDVEFSGYGIFLVDSNIKFDHNTYISESGGSVVFIAAGNIEVNQSVTLTGNMWAQGNINLGGPVTINGSVTLDGNLNIYNPLTINYKAPSASITDKFWEGVTDVHTDNSTDGVQVISITNRVIEGRL